MKTFLKVMNEMTQFVLGITDKRLKSDRRIKKHRKRKYEKRKNPRRRK